MRRHIRNLLLLSGTAMLAGCQSMSLKEQATADTPGHVAHVYVSAYPPVPWSSIAPKLSPANSLTIDQARAMAAAPTQIETAQFLSSFAAGLNLSAVPHSADSPTASTTGIPTATLPATAPVADFSKVPPNLALNGATLLQEGTALFQRAQILDNQIANQVLPEGYRPFLITFQFDVQPHQGDLDYDAYTDLTIVPADLSARLGSSSPSKPAIRIFPVVISDTSEVTSVGRSVEAMQQAQATLTAIFAHSGLGGSIGSASDKAAMILGPDMNSLVTAGRVTDSTVRIRFGATNSGRSGRAVAAGTYNISFLVLVDDAVPTVAVSQAVQPTMTAIRSLAVVTQTSFKDRAGHPVAAQNEDSYNAKIAGEVCDLIHSDLANYDAVVISPLEARICPEGDRKDDGYSKESFLTKDGQTKPAIEKTLKFLWNVDRGNYADLKDAVPSDSSGLAVDVTLHRLISSLEQLQVRQKLGEVTISLPAWSPTLPDSDQIGFLADDGKQSAIVSLRNAKDLDTQHLKAWLKYDDGPTAKGSVLPTAITVTGGGSEVDLTFPSAALVYSPHADATTPRATSPTFDGKNLVLTFDPDSVNRGRQALTATYTVRTIKPAPVATIQAANPVQVTNSLIVPDPDGYGHLTLHIGTLEKVAPKGSLHLLVSGADIDGRSGLPGALAASAKIKGVDINQGTTPVLALGSLAPGQTVTLQTVDDSDPALITYGAQIVLTVGNAAPRK